MDKSMKNSLPIYLYLVTSPKKFEQELMLKCTTDTIDKVVEAKASFGKVISPFCLI